jgi:Secretion system C-terminal sorting domain
VQPHITAPTDYTLYQNYPNPFNPSTIIKYKLEIPSKVILKVYDLLGREIITFVNEYQQAGIYSYNFSSERIVNNKSAFQLSSGIYFYRLSAGNFSDIKKMILIR